MTTNWNTLNMQHNLVKGKLYKFSAEDNYNYTFFNDIPLKEFAEPDYSPPKKVAFRLRRRDPESDRIFMFLSFEINFIEDEQKYFAKFLHCGTGKSVLFINGRMTEKLEKYFTRIE
jgi:hypothetical protein